MDNSPVEDFFAQYEDLAVAIIDDERPNVQIGTDLCNADMAEAICQILDWEYFDLFEEHDFATAYEATVPQHILAYCWIAFLRWELWLTASAQGVGDEGFNEKACAHSQLWYLRLRDRYVSVVSGEETKHQWLQ